MMLSDAPRYRSGGRRRTTGSADAITAEEEADEVLQFFASNLKQ